MRATGLTKPSVVNVYDIPKVLRADFLERAGRLEPEQRAALDEALRLVLARQGVPTGPAGRAVGSVGGIILVHVPVHVA
jgi:hypothetical protein